MLNTRIKEAPNPDQATQGGLSEEGLLSVLERPMVLKCEERIENISSKQKSHEFCFWERVKHVCRHRNRLIYIDLKLRGKNRTGSGKF